MAAAPDVIEVTAGEVAEELKRRGIGSDERVTLTIEPDQKDRSLPSIAVHLVSQRGALLKSAATEQQLLSVLARPYLAPLIAPATYDWITRVVSHAELVTISEHIAACRDPTDDKFLELAVNGRADFLLTGGGPSTPSPAYAGKSWILGIRYCCPARVLPVHAHGIDSTTEETFPNVFHRAEPMPCAMNLPYSKTSRSGFLGALSTGSWPSAARMTKPAPSTAATI